MIVRPATESDASVVCQFISDLEETTLDNLAGLKTAEKAARLFLQAYASERDKFTIFPVPVIPLNLARPAES